VGNFTTSACHRPSQGYTPERKFWCNSRGSVSAPQVAEEVNFSQIFVGGEGWRVGVVNLAVLAGVLNATTKNVINFLMKKVNRACNN